MNGKTESDDAQKERKNRTFWNVSGKEPENYGRYFGVCFSYHNSKVCICGSCLLYPGSGNMFCARGKSRLTTSMFPEKRAGCLCRDCELYRKFRFEGQYFCRE